MGGEPAGGKRGSVVERAMGELNPVDADGRPYGLAERHAVGEAVNGRLAQTSHEFLVIRDFRQMAAPAGATPLAPRPRSRRGHHHIMGWGRSK